MLVQISAGDGNLDGLERAIANLMTLETLYQTSVEDLEILVGGD